jgi:hypothetical protein
MAKPDGRIEKGQRLSTAISARAWNRAQDAADIVLGARPGFSVPQTIGPGSRLVLPMQVSALGVPYNYTFGPGSAVTFDRGSAAGFRLLADGNNIEAYADVELFRADVLDPRNGDDTTYPYGQSFGITLAGGKLYDVVPVVINGYAICRIHVISFRHQFAKGAVLRSTGETKDNLRGCLESTECGCDGTAKILFHEPGSTYPEIRWGMVVL